MKERWKIRVFLLCLAFFLIYFGIKRDEALLIFNKAVRICMECIGLG